MLQETQFRIRQPVHGGNFQAETGEAIPFVLPGELVEVDPLRVVQTSSNRVAPLCVHFGTCGGCQYQHASYASQLEFKFQILRGLFAEESLIDLPPIQVHRGEEWRYRNRIRLRIGRSPDGSFRAGYSRRASNEFLPIRMCPIASPLLWRAAERLLTVAEGDPLCRRWFTAVSEVELFTTGDESRLQLQFFLREPVRDDGLHSICERLRAEIPEFTGAGAELDAELSRRVRRGWTGCTWGAPGLNYQVDGRDYWVSRGAFFQVNCYLLGKLVDLVCNESAGSLAWDLFAGVGLFARVLTKHFEHVIAVEGGAIACGDLLAASKGGKEFVAVQSATLDFLRGRELQRERPDLIVLDPPRAGLGVEASTILTRIGAPRVVYVSCDPVTLARDLVILTRLYRIDTIELIDLFPQTFHMETVVHLSRR